MLANRQLKLLLALAIVMLLARLGDDSNIYPKIVEARRQRQGHQ